MRRTVLGVALAACICMGLGAQSAPTIQASPPPPPLGGVIAAQADAGGSVVGHVYCGDSHLPARLAQVMLRRIPSAEDMQPKGRGQAFGFSMTNATTDMDGSFEMRNVAPGSYYIDVIYPGYVSPASKVSMQDMMNPDPAVQDKVQQVLQRVTVGERDSTRADVTLDRGGALSGTVTYEDGSPAANISVSVSAVSADGQTPTRGRGGIMMTNSRTDDRGWFRISGLQPGTYWVTANVNLPGKPTTRPVNANNNRVFIPMTFRNVIVYAPSAFHRADAEKYTVGVGDERDGITIRITMSDLHVVTGHVTQMQDSSKNARNFITLREAGSDNFFHAGQVDDDGNFRIEDVPDGNYTIVNGQQSVQVSVHGKDVSDVVLGVPAGAQ